MHALPISSRHNFATHVPIKPEPNQEGARYIAPNPQDVLNPIISRSTKKRRADALDRAVDKKIKKQKSSDSLLPALSLLSRAALERRSSNTTNPPSPRDDVPDRTGSPERLVGKKRRSSGVNGAIEAAPRILHRATSMSVLPERTSGTMIPRPRSATTRVTFKKEPVADAVERSETELKNRDQLNKIVLEEMRRYGLKDYRKDKDQRAKSIMPPGEDMMEVAFADEERELWKKREDEREEYKNVFHHTVKAAVFSLRNDKLGETVVMADRMRAVVTRLLGVFLVDVKKNAGDVARSD